MEITYEMIEPIIVSQEVEGQMVKLKFKAENQDTPMETVGVIMPDQDEIMKKAMAQAGKAAAVGAATSAASSMLGNAIGGVAGGLVSSGASMASSAATSKMMNPQDMMSGAVNDESIKKATVEAFKHFMIYYKMVDGKWVYEMPGA